MDSAGGLQSPEAGRAPVALDFPAGEASSSCYLDGRIPRRIRRRFLESRGRRTVPSSVEEIEAKLKEADLRRQQFHEWLSSKARPKPRSPSWSSQEEDLGQRLEARLNAAERKRLGLLAKAQMRLAKLDELRQAAKNDVEKRFEKEREELGTRVEYRVQQAEVNRMHLLKARMQRRAAAQERKARSLSQRVIREAKYKERVRSAISQRRAAAEKKRIGLLEEEKKRAHARVVQAYKVAKIVCNQRESERRRLKEQLENRLQRAKQQRAEYLKQRGSPHSSARMLSIKHGDDLSKKIARCWRSFVRLQRTTFSLAQTYEALGLNEISVKLMPFEQLALIIESSTTLKATKAFLDRLESRLSLLLSSDLSSTENIDHLLKHLATPKRVPPGRITRKKGGSENGGFTRGSKRSRSIKLSRYPVRIILCAYMILGHPNAVFSGHGEHEAALRESAVNFVRDFETLIRVILDGTRSGCSSRQSSRDVMPHDSSTDLPSKKSFRSQLSEFDAAWRSYLYRFVAWKVKDAESLEEDLVQAACQLEVSMIQTCKLTSSGESHDLSQDMRAIQKQVIEDQKLLREKVLHLSGDAGIERMECALSDTRSKYFVAMEASNQTTAVAYISSPSTYIMGKPLVSDPHLPSPLRYKSLISKTKEQTAGNNGRSNHAIHSLFGSECSFSPSSVQTVQNISAQSMGERPPSENELLVNEFLHDGLDTSIVMDSDESESKIKVKGIMEKAFWDSIMESMKEDASDFNRVLGLVREIQDELIELAPQSWKQEIMDNIDLDILSQVLRSGIEDFDYLGKVLQYMLSVLQKLSAVASEEEMIMVHQKMLGELRDMTQSDDKPKNVFHYATIKGLRFVLEQIQKLKKEASKARIQLIEPIIKGSAGLEYLQKAFADRYGEPSAARRSLPLALQWISSLRNNILEDEWNEYTDSHSVLSSSNGLPPATCIRAGGALPLLMKQAGYNSGPDELPQCKGEETDKTVRLGLLRLASTIEGMTSTTVPETLKLNILRLRSVQSQLQQIIVIATSALILRQILLSENAAAFPSLLESVISATVKALIVLFASMPDVGMEEIIDTMVNSSRSYTASSTSEAKVQSRKETMTRLLMKSLQNNDPVFTKVSRAVYVATRGVVLGGTGTLGQQLADAALRRIGAGLLLERVVNAAETLLTMALVTTNVHGSWYRHLL